MSNPLLFSLFLVLVSLIHIYIFKDQIYLFIKKNARRLAAVTVATMTATSGIVLLTYNNPEDPPPLPLSDDWWIEQELQPYEVFRPPLFNYTKFWKVLLKYIDWKLEAKHPVSGEWLDQTGLLIINRTYPTDDSCKIAFHSCIKLSFIVCFINLST